MRTGSRGRAPVEELQQAGSHGRASRTGSAEELQQAGSQGRASRTGSRPKLQGISSSGRAHVQAASHGRASRCTSFPDKLRARARGDELQQKRFSKQGKHHENSSKGPAPKESYDKRHRVINSRVQAPMNKLPCARSRSLWAAWLSVAPTVLHEKTHHVRFGGPGQ